MSKGLKGTVDLNGYCDHLLNCARENPHFVVGPVVWGSAHQWYFALACTNEGGEYGHDLIAAKNKAEAEDCRATLLGTLISRKAPVILHDVDDELEMAKLCVAVWPCDKTRRILSDIEDERRRASN